jgi:F-type H+-transporting ATPase subunit a
MEEHKLVIVDTINNIFVWILSHIGIAIKKGSEIIPSHVVMAVIATLIVIIFFKLTVKNLGLFPGKMQNVLETLYKAFQSLIDDVIGHEGRKFLPALATMGIFIACANLLGLFPEMASPTANLNVTVGCAIFIFVYYHYQGVKKHGFLGYLKTFAGPAWWLAWLFFPIEIISHFSRPLSLSMRLFGNIFGEDLVIIIIASLIPYIAPLPMMAFAIFTSLLQAFIFVMLSAIYLSGAMASEH